MAGEVRAAAWPSVCVTGVSLVFSAVATTARGGGGGEATLATETSCGVDVASADGETMRASVPHLIASCRAATRVSFGTSMPTAPSDSTSNDTPVRTPPRPSRQHDTRGTAP